MTDQQQVVGAAIECTIKYKCKTLYNNPHNNGGTCPKCAVQEENETSDEEDEGAGQNDEVIPVVPPTQHDGIDTDSDMSDGEEQVSVSND